MSNVIHLLRQRGLVDALSSEELKDAVEKPLKVYAGFDPTADSLHLGHLTGIMTLSHFQRHGHVPIVILGGMTARIGDPSGKSKERPLLDIEAIQHNTSLISRHFKQILDFSHLTAKPILLNNEEWLGSYLLVDFLRDIGKHFRLGPMLAKESVRNRLESEEGLSFTEFTYQLLQAYDFYYLFSQYGSCLQIGGSDQWGNITAGIELIRKLTGRTSYGLTFPLLTRSDGKKFGKTEEGTIWLSADRCSPYQFYQYLIRLPDNDITRLMKMITFMDLEEIHQIEQEMKLPNYIPNTAQKRLAEEVTRLVHGEEGVQIALRVTKGAAPGSETALDIVELQKIITDMPHDSLKKEELVGKKFTDIACRVGLVPSKGAGICLIKNRGAYLNNQRIEDPEFRIELEHLIGGQFLLLGHGKTKKILIRVL